MKWTLIQAMAVILQLISAILIWTLEKLFPNYEPLPIKFVEVLANRNYSNKLTGLAKIPRPQFCKISQFNGTLHFEYCNILSIWSIQFIDTSIILVTCSKLLYSENINGSKPQCWCSFSSLSNAVFHNLNPIIPISKLIISFLPTIGFTITSMMSKISFIAVWTSEHCLVYYSSW